MTPTARHSSAPSAPCSRRRSRRVLPTGTPRGSPGGVPTCLRRLRLARRLLSSTVMQLTPDLLLRAYALGIFPMAESRIDPELHWIDPDMRGITIGRAPCRERGYQ